MIHYWHQANIYAKFIIVLGLAFPASMGLLAYKIEKMFPDPKEKAQVGGNRARA